MLEAILDDAKPPPGQLVSDTRTERQRLRQRAEPKSCVGEPRLAIHFNAQHEVGARPHDTGRSSEFDACEHRLDVRAKCLERSLQEQVLLEAVATARLTDELALQILQLERHLQATVWVEVLEGDRRDLGTVYLGQTGTSAEVDSLDIRVQVEHDGNVATQAARTTPLRVASAGAACLLAARAQA